MKGLDGPRVGEAAPALQLPLEGGGTYTLAARPGHPVLVSFLSHAA